MQIDNSRFSSIQQVTGKYLSKTSDNRQVENNNDESFLHVLQKQVNEADGLKFSKHANARINSRQINISEEQMKRLQDMRK